MVQVLLATYNGCGFIEEQVNSILRQTYQDFKILIRDDGSTDGTVDVVDRLASLNPGKIEVYTRVGENKGVRQNFEELLKMSTANYVMFSDQDDVWFPEKIQISLDRVLSAERDYGCDKPLLAFTDLSVVDADLNLLSSSFWGYQKLDVGLSKNWRDLVVQNVVTGCTVIMNKAARDVCLPFPNIEMLHDHWVASVISKNGFVLPIDSPTIYYRQHGANVEAARVFNFFYVFKKLLSLGGVINKSKCMAQSMGEEMSSYEILRRKFIIGFRRFF